MAIPVTAFPVMFFFLSLVDCCAAPKNNRLNKNIQYLPLLYLRFEQKASDRIINSNPYEISRNFIFCLPFHKKMCIYRQREISHCCIRKLVCLLLLWNWNGCLIETVIACYRLLFAIFFSLPWNLTKVIIFCAWIKNVWNNKKSTTFNRFMCFIHERN